MSRISTQTQRTLRTQRSRAKLKGTEKRPRLSLRISNKYVDAQVVNDSASKTVAHARTTKKDAEKIASALAAELKKAKVTAVVMDRGSKKYHGVIAVVADGLRKEGINL